MTHPQMERILLQIKFTLKDTHGTPEARSILALHQVNNALYLIQQEQFAAARDQALHIKNTAYDKPERTDTGDTLEA